MGDYVHLFADETERTQYERSAQYNEPYISATDDTFDAEYNKRQDKQYVVKYTDLENNMHDFTYVEYDAEIEYLQSTGTQWIDTGVNYDFTGTIKIIAQVIPINQNRSIIISNYCDGNTASMSCELGGTSNSHALQPRFYMSLTKAATVKDTWRSAFTLNTSNEIILQYNKSNGQKIFTTQGSSTTETFTGNKYGTPRNFILFLDHRSDPSAIAYGVRIQKIQIYINNQLVSDLIPVRVGNTGYMYDKVSCQLLGNSGSGNFVLGPDKYDAQVEYLQSTDRQCIDTGLIPNQNTSIEIQYMDLRSSISNYFLYGARPGNANDREFSCMPYNNGRTDFRFGNKSAGTAYTYTLNTKYKIISVKNKFTLYNSSNSVIHTNTVTNNTFSSSCNLFLFGNNYNGTQAPVGKLRIYMFKFTDNSTLVRDMIPVRVGQVGYMYDRVSGKLFANAGSGQFVLGPDV